METTGARTDVTARTEETMGRGGRIGVGATSEETMGRGERGGRGGREGRGGRNWRFSSLASPNWGGGVMIGSVGPSSTEGAPEPGVLGRRRPKRFKAHLRKPFKSPGASARHSEKAVNLGHREVRYQVLHKSSVEQEASWNQAAHVN